jgi:hypothetical protein
MARAQAITKDELLLLGEQQGVNGGARRRGTRFEEGLSGNCFDSGSSSGSRYFVEGDGLL